MALVPAGLLAQPVVDVERRHRRRPARPHRQVEHADGVPPPRQHHDEDRGIGEQTARLNASEKLVCNHGLEFKVG